METKINWMICLLAGLLFGACSGNRPVQRQGVLEADPDIFPDYKGVTVPMNIAPLNFSYLGNEPCRLVVEVAGHELMQMEGRRGLFSFPVSDWKDWMGRYAGDSLRLTVLAYQSDQWKRYRSFSIYIAPDSIDSYLSYRLVPPGYEGWREMGIYQRDLSDYEQRPILENRLTKGNCVNCHAYCERDPSRMMFHARADLAGTLILQDGLVEKLDVQTEQMGSFVYPYWHPSGDYIAFSMNKTRQNFYSHDPDRVEVYDTASDVVIYSVKDHKIMTSPLLRSTCAFETFPTFSPDGHFLYFCSAVAVDSLPQNCRQVKYSLCRIAFDFQNERLGEVVDTLYNARMEGQSVSFPRLSPDGRFLAFTLHDFGNFSIWHKEADLYMLDLLTSRKYPLDVFNSEEAESYHSWSGNGRWMVFSSRRIDGLYTRLFIGYVDSEGVGHKPFLLPQKDPLTYYDALMFSYNIPELMRSAVTVDACRLAGCLRSGKKSNLR